MRRTRPVAQRSEGPQPHEDDGGAVPGEAGGGGQHRGEGAGGGGRVESSDEVEGLRWHGPGEPVGGAQEQPGPGTAARRDAPLRLGKQPLPGQGQPLFVRLAPGDRRAPGRRHQQGQTGAALQTQHARAGADAQAVVHGFVERDEHPLLDLRPVPRAGARMGVGVRAGVYPGVRERSCHRVSPNPPSRRSRLPPFAPCMSPKARQLPFRP